VVGFGGNDRIHMAPTLTIAAVVSEGAGTDRIVLGSGNNVVVVGNGIDHVTAGNGNNQITLGNGTDTVRLGGGNNLVVGGTGNDTIKAGKGDNLLIGGLGHDSLTAGNGSNILIDGSVQLTQSSDSLAQVLGHWVQSGLSTSNVAAIRAALQVTYNAADANTLHTGTGLDWFWYTYAKDHKNRKATDLLN
jgi:Ca2+-binding RTX toxin-like protein